MIDFPEKDDESGLAAEYALGLLEGEEHLAARARILTDPVFARHVADWQENMAVMAETVEAVPPLTQTKQALEARLFGKSQKRSIWNFAGLWQAVSVASIAVAAFLAFTLVNLPDPEPATLYVTELASENDALRVLAVYNDATKELQVSRTNGGPAAGRDLELWVIPEGEKPVSIGVLPQTANGTFTLPPGLETALEGLTLAITDEPLGGSPTGDPTGEAVAAAQISRI